MSKNPIVQIRGAGREEETLIENPIKSVRRQEHMTQSDLALLAGVSIGFMSSVERGGATRSFGALEEVLEDLGYVVEAVWEA